MSATRQELEPDLVTAGMFPKFWHRNGSDIELWKTDKTGGMNARCEAQASHIKEEETGSEDAPEQPEDSISYRMLHMGFTKEQKIRN